MMPGFNPGKSGPVCQPAATWHCPCQADMAHARMLIRRRSRPPRTTHSSSPRPSIPIHNSRSSNSSSRAISSRRCHRPAPAGRCLALPPPSSLSTARRSPAGSSPAAAARRDGERVALFGARVNQTAAAVVIARPWLLCWLNNVPLCENAPYLPPNLASQGSFWPWLHVSDLLDPGHLSALLY